MIAATPTDTRQRRRIALATGVLDIEIAHSDIPFDHLCGFAARRNPRRGFLFVSRVLGRHLPVRPSVMRDTQTRLARRIPADLPGPVVVIGLAETAICLAQGVHHVWTELSGRDDVLFLHTTRYRLDAPIAFVFEEEHSHASRHFVHAPIAARDVALVQAARTLIIVDDEASTGDTFVNLSWAFARARVTARGPDRIVCVTLTNWSAPFTARMPAQSDVISLLQGSYRFTPAPNAAAVAMPYAIGNDAAKGSLIARNLGRQGVRSALGWHGVIPETHPGERILVLGTGEFTWLPFRLAERMQASGADVWCQATTRSPAMVGHDVASVVTFPDNYQDNIANFLYNYAPGQYDRVILCHETPNALLPSQICQALDAIPFEM